MTLARKRALLPPLAFLAFSAAAAADLPPEGQRIRSHDYRIDLAQTSVLAGTRVTGLGGAFVAIGEGTDGSAQNSAAVAHRDPWSRTYFDYDVSVAFALSSTTPSSDLFNSGSRVLRARGDDESFVFLNVAGNLQFGNWGIGLAGELQEYSLRRASAPATGEQSDRFVARFVISHATAGHAFADGQVLVGLGTRNVAVNVVNANAPGGGEEELFSAEGTNFESGVLIRPHGTQLRVGLAFRTAVTAQASPASRIRVVYAEDPNEALYLPDQVTLPWELHAGLAVQFGPRPFNPRWLDPSREIEEIERFLVWRQRERARRRIVAQRQLARRGGNHEAALRALDAELETQAALDALHLQHAEAELNRRLRERYRGMERFRVLLVGSLQALGAVDDGVGVESFLERTVQRSGSSISLSPRLGIETEAVPHWTRVRAGTYIEPSRFAYNANGARVHGTVGFDQRLIAWTLFGLLPEESTFRVTGALDVARAYLSWGLAIGMWH